MRNHPKLVDVAVIGGSGLETLMESPQRIHVRTPYGSPPPITLGELGGRRAAFLPRHGYKHELPPHRINYRANIYGLYSIGVRRIFAMNAVGAVKPSLKVGDIIVPDDLIDFTKQRPLTFFEDSSVIHVDFTEPYCPELRGALIRAAGKEAEPIHERGVYACMEGPRDETRAEIRMLRRLGCDVVGMTAMPEAVLARELGVCYASLCYVTNMAAGIGDRVIQTEVMEAASRIRPKLSNILIWAVSYLPRSRCCRCVRDGRGGGAIC
ncbi:MAG: 5'-methylthioadenosine phosphorylase [Candidatus Bathyarchaeota archaeon B63]|nr:MAG: 5'-methylthioadenosine phosphorylase [Candidatus Bathyarchaeota archaeon B63]